MSKGVQAYQARTPEHPHTHETFLKRPCVALVSHSSYLQVCAQRAREAALAAKRQERSVARALRRRQEYVRRCRLDLEERRRKVRGTTYRRGVGLGRESAQVLAVQR